MIVYTGGTFDILHYGHIRFLKKCKELAGEQGRVVVALNSDEFVQRFKKKKPVLSFIERKMSLMELGIVEEVIRNTNGEDSKPTILKVKPHLIAVGSDWAVKNYYKQMNFTQDWLDSNGIMLCYIPYTKFISTTDIKRRAHAHIQGK